jgi:DNA-binding transcriptional LysR family regulator
MGSLGRAAVALGVSQPAVSKRLRSLEDLAGSELLVRSPRGVVLTPAGRTLYPLAQKLLGQAAALQLALGALGSERIPIRLAVSHTVAEHYLPARLVEYDASDSSHHAPLELTAANSQAVRRMLLEDRADIGVAAVADATRDSKGSLDGAFLFDDAIVVAVPQSHLWYQRESIPRAQFLQTPMIVRDPEAHSRRLVDAVLAAQGEQLAFPVAEVGNSAVAKREALELNLPVLLSRMSIDEQRDHLYVRPIEGIEFPRRFFVLYGSEHTLSAPQRRLVDFLSGRTRS